MTSKEVGNVPRPSFCVNGWAGIIADTVGGSRLLLDRLTNQRQSDFLEAAVSGYLTTCLQLRGRGRGLVTTETQYTMSGSG